MCAFCVLCVRNFEKEACAIRGKKYKARDKTVKKSSRDGLTEVNLHSRKSVKISSRETESLIQKAPDSVNLQETYRQRTGGTAGKRKPRSRTDSPAKPGENTGRHDGVKEKPVQDAVFAAEQMKAGSQVQDSVHDLKIEKESSAGYLNSRPPDDRLDGLFYGQEDVEDGTIKKNFGSATDGRMDWIGDAGTGNGVAQAIPSENKESKDAGSDMDEKPDNVLYHKKAQAVRLVHDGVMQAGLSENKESEYAGTNADEKPDNVLHHKKARAAKLMHDGVTHAVLSENKETEDAGSDADGMDEKPDNVPYHEKTQVLKPARNNRGENLQRQIFQKSARTENIREQTGRRYGRKGNKRSRRKENAGHDVLRDEKTDAVRGQHGYTAGNDSRPETAQAGGGGNWDKDIFGGSDTAADIPPCGRNNTAADIPSRGSDTGQGLPSHSARQKKEMQRRPGRFILAEKKKPEDCRQDVLEDRPGRRDTETKGRSVDAARPSENGSRTPDKKHRKTGQKKRKNGSRLIFEDADNGMVRGAGMGIVKRAGPSVFRAVEESGNITSEDSADAEPENTYRFRRSRAADGLRNVFRRSARSSLYMHSYMKENRAGMQTEKEEKTVETAGRRKSPQKQGRTRKKSDAGREQAEKKAARRRQQKQRNKRAYQSAARRRFTAGRHAGPAPSVLEKKEWLGAGKRQPGSFSFFRGRKNSQWILAAVFLFFLAVMSMFSSCSILFQGISGIAGTTYPSSDEDIYDVEDRYLELENALDGQINSMEAAHPGYDEYRYQVDEISHNPYQLISYLTVVCPGFTYEQADSLLQELFERQYHLTVWEQTETRTDPDSGETYEWHILCISLKNRGIDAVAHEYLTPGQEELYKAYNLTSGNRSYLFGEENDNGGDSEAQAPGNVPEIPREALSDQRFANMLNEAEKYLGYPYVWGGSSPQTSFDCSGFVSWVVNQCGNGWNVGRQTAEGLRNCCTYVSPQEAKPGDLIFFQGTYQTAGASHVGIYVGNNRMLHCGNPIQYAELGAYWQQHFLQYGRLP